MSKTNITFLLLITISFSLCFIKSATSSKRVPKIPDFENEYSLSIERDSKTRTFLLSFDDDSIKNDYFEYKLKIYSTYHSCSYIHKYY